MMLASQCIIYIKPLRSSLPSSTLSSGVAGVANRLASARAAIVSALNFKFFANRAHYYIIAST
jgi:hypothetical protein